MREQIFFMIELQKIDSEIEKIRIRKNDLPKKKDVLEEKLKSLKEGLEEKTKGFDELNKAYRDKEGSLKSEIESLKRTKERLLQVKTNKEYQATLKEIEVLGEKNGEIEDEIILILDEIDKARNNLKVAEGEYASYLAKHEKEMKEIESEFSSIDSMLDDLYGKSEDMRKKINPDLLKKFDVIKKRKSGKSVIVPVYEEICSGCHMNIPPQMYNELQKFEELIFCPHCSRIIYWSEMDNGKEV